MEFGLKREDTNEKTPARIPTGDNEKRVCLKSALVKADGILIGGGAGLSASAGFSYSGERFRSHFGDFEEAYGFHDMYAGGFYPYPSPEAYWAYWSRYIKINRYENPERPVYDRLHQLLLNKDYFVLTTNVDHSFQKAGFDPSRLFYTQGDYGLFQCSLPCSQTTYENKHWIDRMLAEQKDMRIPSELIPRCPVCGRPMTMNLRSDDRFVEDPGWHKAAQRYSEFIRLHKGKRMLLLELGVGYNTPGIIKYPFWRMTAENPKATYVCINEGRATWPRAIAEQTLFIQGDIGRVLEEIHALESVN